MKTERQKMLDGELYNPADPDLVEQWYTAKELMLKYNTCPPRDHKQQEELRGRLLGKGNKVSISAPFFCDYGNNIFIGENTEINHNCVFLDCNRIEIGSNVLIGPSVQIYTPFHPLKSSDRSVDVEDVDEFTFCKIQSAPVTVGDDVWIGGGSIILPGVSIGENSTIGAGSVVTKSIPANVLAYGNPCKVIKEI